MNDDLDITPALLERLDKPVPRYTSYPTADRFVACDASIAAEALARADVDVDVPLALYVHIPFCARLCTYCGCAVVVTQSDERKAEYVDRVIREVDLVAAHLPHRRRVRELHFGGGTPNSVDPVVLARLVDHLRRTFIFESDAELSIELDPRRVVDGQLEALRAMGFSRVSFGVQDTDDEVQSAIGRDQGMDVTRAAVVGARFAGFTSINIDLVYGLPQQTRDSFARTLRDVVDLNPDRIALFSFAFVPHVRPNQRRINPASLPASALKLELFCDARRAFKDAGYLGIGMDHFARPGDPLATAWQEGRLSRTFQGYAVGMGGARTDVVGFGMSAISDIGGAYLQDAKDLKHWEQAIDEGRLPTTRGYVLTDDDEARRFAIRELMCRFRLDDETLQAQTGRQLARDFGEALVRLQPLQRDGLVTVSPGLIEVTPLGRLFVRLAAAAFDATLGQAASTASDITHLAPFARILLVTALGAPLATLPGCRLVSGEVACVADVDCDPGAGLLCVDGTCVDPCRDPAADGCDEDNDGTLNEDDTGPKDPCIPDQNVAACSVGDEDGDGVNNTADPFPGDPCRPDAEVLACFDGDEDGDGVRNGQDPAPEEPCTPTATMTTSSTPPTPTPSNPASPAKPPLPARPATPTPTWCPMAAKKKAPTSTPASPTARPSPAPPATPTTTAPPTSSTATLPTPVIRATSWWRARPATAMATAPKTPPTPTPSTPASPTLSP